MGVRLVLDAARGHVKGIRLHRVARELLVEVRIKIPGPSLEHEPRGPALHQESSRLRERNEVAARVGPQILWCLAAALYKDPGATLGDIREAVATFEEIEPTARRVLGSAHPDATAIGVHLKNSRAALRARESS